MRKKLPTKIKLYVNIPTSGCLTNIVEEIMHKKMEKSLLHHYPTCLRYTKPRIHKSIDLESVCFFSFLLKAICFQTLGRLFFFFFFFFYKLFTK